MSKKAILAYLVVVTITVSLLTNGNSVYAEKDECKGVGTNHGDNSPSEKAFFKAIKTDNICEITKKIDAMKLEGAIEEDSKCDWKCFINTPVFKEKPQELSEDGFIEIKGCMLVRYEDFPKSNGDPHLAEYEIKNCGLGKY